MGPLSNTDRKNLEKNPNVLKVTESTVTYKPSFKVKALKQLSKGSSPKEIFESAGIDLSQFNPDYAKKTLQRWRKIFNQFGEDGLKEERRGSGATGRPKGIKFKNLEEEIAYLRAEVEFLKKIRALDEKEEREARKKGSL